MTDLEKLAQWHEAGAVCEVRYDNAEQQRDHHSAAAATIRAAMGEIERLRGQSGQRLGERLQTGGVA
jgi:hypothetical protein